MKINYYLILFFVYILAACSKDEVQKIQETKVYKKNIESEKIGTVEAVKKVIVDSDANYEVINGDVSHKRSKAVVWGDSDIKTNLYLKDWVKTGDGSNCTINIKEKRLIKMSQNSTLILLDKVDKEKVKRAVIGVSEGDVEGQIEGQEGVNSEIVFKLPHAWLRVKSSLKKGVKKIFRISLTSDEMKIYATKGEVEVLTKGKTIKLSESKVYQKKIPQALANTKKTDFINQTEPPVELKELTKKPLAKAKNTVKNFILSYPKTGDIVTTENIVARGIIPNGQELVFKGEKILVNSNKFKVNINLDLGINILTFQVINGEKVKYVTIEVERK